MLGKDNTLENKFQDEEEIFVEMQRMPPPPGFNPNFQPPQFPGGNFPGGNFPGGNFPGNSQQGGNNPGSFNPAQLGAPPSHIPQKDAKGVQSFSSSGHGGPQTKAVSQNSIRFCLFQFTYIWEVSGRAYWAFLLNVDRVSVSGLRWLGRRWVYFGVDLRRIDSFICYRNNCENCQENNLYRCSTETSFENKKKLYTNCEIKESVSKTLVSLDIPEVKDDFLVHPIGIINGETIESSTPCVKSRNTQYTINLEITYPDNLDKNIKDKIIEYAHEASKETATIINAVRGNDNSINPLENFNNCTKVISKILEGFSSEFNSNLRDPEIGKDVARNVSYSITQGKSTDNWKTKI